MDLYYYTTAETMKYVLSGGNVFATNMQYMNDSEEYLNGLKEVRNYLLHKVNSLDPLRQAAERKLTDAVYERRMEGEVNSFSISFSTARDRLSQWSMYARESGVSLKMEFEEKDYEFLTYNPVDRERDKKVNYCMRPQKVHYFTEGVLKKETYIEVGNEIVEEMREQFRSQGMKDYDDNIEKLWLWITPFVKRADFGAEEEYRLVFDLGNVLAYTPRVDFRVERNVIKPYLDIGTKDGWPITEIIVGPGFNQGAVFKGISYFLSKAAIRVPFVSAFEMKKRIQNYFEGMKDAGIPEEEIRDVIGQWNEKYHAFDQTIGAGRKGSTNILYSEFGVFLKSIKSNASYKEYIQNNYFAASGIVLRKSKIPYIY